MDFRTAFIFLPGFLVGITIHEAAHALMSKWLGDRCAEKQGRISLNPMRHLSATGTMLLFLVGFGWGKPVPINLYNYKHPKLYNLLSSLAGPISNILLAIMLVLIGIVFYVFKISWNRIAFDIVAYSITINLLLASINLIPIPPLDGSAIWPCLIPGMRPVHSGKTMKFWVIVLFLLFIFHVPSMAAEFAGRQFVSYLQKIKHRELVFPENFPAEMQTPDNAYGIHYDRTTNTRGEPNAFTGSFWIHQPYPAKEYRSQLVEKMKKQGWLRFIAEGDNNDPNEWQMSDIKDDEGDQYRILVWSEIWEKENSRFHVNIKYYADPNGQNPEELMIAEYKYAIMHPESTK
jgi:Zn-dependent protease